ncbi:unnamed protein product [Sympodiomycopsis kandeliae]
MATQATVSSLPSEMDPLSILIHHASSLSSITYTSSDGTVVSDLLSSTFVHFPHLSDSDDSSAPIPIPKNIKTRAIRSRTSQVLQPDSLALPSESEEEDDFLPLDALIFLLQTQNEPVGLYAVKATRERVARVDTLDRPTLLDFLLGKKEEKDCEVVLSLEECQSRREKKQSSLAQGDVASTAADSLPSAQEQTATDLTSTSADSASQQASTSAAPISASAPSSTASLHPLLAGGKRPYNPSKQDATFVKRLRTAEVVLRDRAWAFRCQKAAPGQANVSAAGGQDEDDEDGDDNAGSIGDRGSTTSKAVSKGEADFSNLRRSVQGRIADLRRGGNGSGSATTTTTSSASRGAASTTSSTPASTLGRSARHRRLDPIIILPSSPSSLLTLTNIKTFLEEGKFLAPSSISTLAPTGGSNEVVVINRPKGGRFLAIDSLDALNRLGNDPWKRVVCIITTGQKWQFKGYKWEEGRELFRNVFGIYPRFTNQEKDNNIKEWNVTELVIEHSKRHHDQQLSAHLWRLLEAWISRKRPELA